MIRIENVSLVKQSTRILDKINLDLPKGGVTALIGPNGAGKSSLLSLVARLQPMQEGKISINDLPVDRTPTSELAKVMAILRQDPSVATRLTVRELVGFGRFPYNRGRLDARDREIIEDALVQFDLLGFADRLIDTLSGGQKQRALVAMAFCQGTEYLLLDEPLNNLDMFYAKQLMCTLRKLADEQGRTIIIVLHDINHAAAHADRIIAMRDGQVVANGAPSEILNSETLQQVFGFHMDVAEINSQLVVLHHQ